jgi:hypothetical protein
MFNLKDRENFPALWSCRSVRLLFNLYQFAVLYPAIDKGSVYV